jgi:hypothetical protein
MSFVIMFTLAILTGTTFSAVAALAFTILATAFFGTACAVTIFIAAAVWITASVTFYFVGNIFAFRACSLDDFIPTCLTGAIWSASHRVIVIH